MSAINSGITHPHQASGELVKIIQRVEESIRRKVPINSTVATLKLKEDLMATYNNERAIDHAIFNLI